MSYRGRYAVEMVKPELKYLHSPDVSDLENVSPRDDEPFCILVQAMFGPEGIDGEESFDVLVCNDLWIAQQVKSGTFSGRHHLIASHFDVDQIRSFWEKVALESAGPNWEDVAQKLGRYGKWEFEDYTG